MGSFGGSWMQVSGRSSRVGGVAEQSAFHFKKLNRHKISPRGSQTIALRRVIVPATLALLPFAAAAQTVSTVRELEFRSRWSNYNADQSVVEPTTARVNPETGEAETGIAPRLRSFFRTGPVVLRASITNGWEYSDSTIPGAQTRKGSDSSFFTAPAVLAAYDREVGPWAVSFRYSAGYLRYLDQNYAPAGGGTAGGVSQTAGLSVARKGSRLAFRTSASASSGSGFDIERNRQTDRKTINGNIGVDYSITEFTRAGATLTGMYQTYSGQSGGLDDTLSNWAATLFAESILTGKTGMRFELGAGQQTQQVGDLTTRDRSYVQGLLRLNYQPTGKLTFTPAIGFGIIDEAGPVQNTQNGFRALYSLAIDYVPTEKTSVRLFVGLEGASSKPELSLALNWHPRENTRFSLSVYQQTGFSTFLDTEERTRRGALLTGQQRLFSRLTLGVGAGWEQEEKLENNLPQPDPYYFYATTLGWEINSWIIWQAQYRYSSGRGGSAAGSDVTETRASTSLQLTF